MRFDLESLELRVFLDASPLATAMLNDVSQYCATSVLRSSFDRRTGETVYQLIEKNTAAQPLPPELYLVVDSVSNAAIKPTNADGMTDQGKPFYKLDLATGAGLGAGANTLFETIKFSNPTMARFTFSTKVLSRAIVGSTGGVVLGENGVQAIVPPNAFSSNTQVSVDAVGLEDLTVGTPTGFQFLGGVQLTLGNGATPLDNLDLGIPAPTGFSSSSNILLAEVIEYSGVQMYDVIDTATLQNGQIVSQDPAFPGVLDSGTYCFLWCPNTVGWIGGTVTEAGMPVSGAVVTLSGGYFLDIADSAGQYGVPALPGNFVVVGFNPVDGAYGQKQGYMSEYGQSVLANVVISDHGGPVENSLANGSFEDGLASWISGGATSAIASLGPINAVSGSSMAFLSSGSGAIGGASSTLEQTFTIPSGATTLTLTYNFVSEEYYEFVGTQYNDVMLITLHTPSGPVEVAFEDVNHAAWKAVSGINFPGGDSTTGETGWKTATLDVSALQGQTVTLTAAVHDVGDTVYDSVLLLDEIQVVSPILVYEQQGAYGLELVIDARETGIDNDVIITQNGSYSLLLNGDHQSRQGSYARVCVYGGPLDDNVNLSGISAATAIWGGGGNNALSGGSGDDHIYATGSYDAVQGLAGNDTIVAIGAGTGDINPGSGTDSVWASTGITVAALSSDEISANALHSIPSGSAAWLKPNLPGDAYVTGDPSSTVPDPSSVTWWKPWSWGASQTFAYASFASHPLFVGTPSVSDIRQGGLGDCYFLAALASIANAEPELIRQSVVDLGDGSYLVRFFTGSGEKYYRVDADLPVVNANQLAFAELTPQDELWVAILEKALAVHDGNSYHETEGGFPATGFSLIAGAESTYLLSSSSTGLVGTFVTPLPWTGIGTPLEVIAGESFYLAVKNALDSGKAVAASTWPWAGDTDPVGQHAYSILDAWTDNTTGEHKYRLYNPWGHEYVATQSEMMEQFSFATIASI